VNLMVGHNEHQAMRGKEKACLVNEPITELPLGAMEDGVIVLLTEDGKFQPCRGRE
jgi:hypothetical protein